LKEDWKNNLQPEVLLSLALKEMDLLPDLTKGERSLGSHRTCECNLLAQKNDEELLTHAHQ
jgi:hypothetical protein